jgi:glutaredoxin-related protein
MTDAMQRRLLQEERIHSAIREKWAGYGSVRIAEVQAALDEHAVVVVGMRQNPYPRRARLLLNRNGIAHHYLEYGSYLSKWQERLPLKLWTGWPTFPMIFVNGALIGGFNELERLVETGELGALLAAPRA